MPTPTQMAIEEETQAEQQPIGQEQALLSSGGARQETLTREQQLQQMSTTLEGAKQQALKIQEGIAKLAAEEEAKKKADEQAKQQAATEGAAVGLPAEPAKSEEQKALEQQITDNDARAKQIDNEFAQHSAYLDTALNAQLDGIRNVYAVQIRDMNEINRRILQARTQAGIRYGTARFAPEIDAGMILGEQQAGAERVGKIIAAQNEAIAQATNAYHNKKYDLMVKKTEIANKLEESKTQALTDIAKLADKRKEEIQKKKAELLKSERKQINEGAIVSLLGQGITNPVDLFSNIRKLGIFDITFDEIADITDKAKQYEKVAPGVLGELQKTIQMGILPEGSTVEDYLNLTDPDRAREVELQMLQIAKIKKELAKMDKPEDGALAAEDPTNILAYAQQYAATGQIPTGIPKGGFGLVAQIAKELPKPEGILVDKNTGITSSKLSATQVDGITALYDITKKVSDLKALDKKRVKGLVGGITGKIFGADDQERYLALRTEIVDLLSRARTGAALTASEEKFYADQLPGRYAEPLFVLGANTQVKLDSFDSKINGALKSKLDINNAAIFGYSKVKIGSREYTVGDIVTNNQGQAGRINADGTITIIE